ncbi:MAG: hypothetical protein NXH83_14720 [Rhodobacteraceae bacterium]|nr:hypothetical protein [Paracoccaceae bacterium]
MEPDGSISLPRPRDAARRIPMGKKRHFTGKMVVGEDEGREFAFESNTERLVALVMLARHDVTNVENQVLFNWVDRAGKARKHFFDFRITLRDGTRIAVVVKAPHKATDAEFRMELSWLASQVTPDFAHRVSLMTANDLDPVEIYNAGLIHSVREPDPEPDAAVRRVIAAIAGPVKIADVVDASGWPGRGFRSVVRLVRSRELELADPGRIEPESRVRRRII